MNVIVLKVKHKENVEELAGVIAQGRTFEGGDGGWQMPGDPDQEYRAYGWVAGIPVKPDDEAMKYYGPVAGVRPLTPVSRKEIAAASGFSGKGISQLAQTVQDRVDDFLLAVGFDKRFVAAREVISDEAAHVLCSRT